MFETEMDIDDRLAELSRLVGKKVKGHKTIDGENTVVLRIYNNEHNFHYGYCLPWEMFFHFNLQALADKIVEDYKYNILKEFLKGV